MVEYRRVPEEDVPAYRRVLDYGFRPEAGPEPEPPDDEAGPSHIGERRAVYEEQRPVTTARHYPFTITIRGEWIEAVGLGAVATLPEARRSGNVRRLLRESLAEYREWDRPFAILWPFKHPFYRKFGWGRLGSVGRYEFAPEALTTMADHPLAGGRFERIDPGEFHDLQSLDHDVAASCDLTMRRTEAWYRHRFFDSYEREPFVYGWFTEDSLGGYLRYDVESTDDGEELRVSDFGAPDVAATVNLLRFIHRHQAQVDTVRIHAPPDDLVFDLLDDPMAVDMELLPGPMGRLVDVSAGLETIPAPPTVEATVSIAVTDDLADWNDGTITVTAVDGSYETEPLDGVEPAAALSVGTLSRLAFGTQTATRAARVGDLEADESTVSLLDDLFPPRDGYLREFF